MKKLQKKDSKKQYQNVKGITLVALVITIVVLLILAGVTIATLFGESGIITKAQKAKGETENGSNKELEGIEEIEAVLDGWKEVKNEKGQVIGVKRGKDELSIGDFIAYDCASEKGAEATYTLKAFDKEKEQSSSGSFYDVTFNAKNYNGYWRVLGANENGELLIIATNNVSRTDGVNCFILGNNGFEGGKAAYRYGIQELNNISAIYGKGTEATGGRSVNVEDINKITGYKPESPAGDINNKYHKGQIDEYENEVTYTWKGGIAPAYTSKNEVNGTLTVDHKNNGFTYWDLDEKKWKNDKYKSTEQKDSIKTLKSTVYVYLPETLTLTQDENSKIGIEHNSKQYEMLFYDTNYNPYWLASSYIATRNNKVEYGLRITNNGRVGSSQLAGSNGAYASSSNYFGLRPVVFLSKNVQLEKGSFISGTIWNIK